MGYRPPLVGSGSGDAIDVDAANLADQQYLRWDGTASTFRGVPDPWEIWRPSDVAAENLGGGRDRSVTGQAGALASGSMQLSGGLVLPPGVPLLGLRFFNGSTAGAGLTHTWGALVRAVDRAVLATTADDTTSSWAAQGSAGAVKTLLFPEPVTLSTWTRAYGGLVVVGTTMPNPVGISANNDVMSQAPTGTPRISGRSTTGLTVPGDLAIGAIAALPAVSAQLLFCQVTK